MHRIKNSLRPLYYLIKGINYPKRTPDFFCIGATRSGSTFLHHLLKTSPDIFLPQTKELLYFNNDRIYKKNLRNYYPLFHGYNGQKLIGEITPLYIENKFGYDKKGNIMNCPKIPAIQRIYRHCPHAKIIITLRDPIKRIISIYIKNFLQGKINTSLEQEIRNELSGLPSLRLLQKNRYDQQLQEVLNHFPSNNVKILFFEEWTENTPQAIIDISKFLGIEPWEYTNHTMPSNAKNTYDTENQAPDINIPPDLEQEIKNNLKNIKPYIERVTDKKISFWNI